MNKFLMTLIVLLSLALNSSAVWAQLVRAGAVKPENAYNPKPDPADLIFPMPCDLKMVFKAVSLPISGRLKDMKTRLGTELEENNPNGFFDRKYNVYLGSALSLADLPRRQQDIAAKSLMNPVTRQVFGDQIYLFGKYEVTNAQFDAVMKGCSPINAQSALPKTDVSWYDALAFTEKYMTYLIKNHPDDLPKFPDDDRYIGLIRLPTDAEWEYAARGGHMVSTEDLESEVLFPLNGKEAGAYGLFYNSVSQASAPSRIGTLLPNPLGVFDTVGNVAEMTLDLFKMTVGGRLHGAATGGFIKKGGSYTGELEDVLPGRRQEVALFERKGATVAPDLGFRLTLSSVATSSVSRLKELASEWKQLGQTAQTETGANPLEKLHRLIQTTEDPAEKATFESLLAEFTDFSVMVQLQKEASIKAHCKNLINTAYSIRNTGRRKERAIFDLNRTNLQLDKFSNEMKKLSAKERAAATEPFNVIKNTASGLKEDIEVFDLAIRNQFNYYKILVKNAVEFDRNTLEDQLMFVFNDIKGDDIYNQELRKFYAIVVDHIKLSLEGQDRKIKLEDLL
ncbi:MAG: formylglycine-generating enzyme family protein [Deltaproteobacteria bacterium]|jgi:hypothetical protein|nr:formylglycine-generating enzyme family protein [Deltaproteobacteria bacterium]